MDAHGGWVTTAVDFLRFLTAVDGTRKPALLAPDTYAQFIAQPLAGESAGTPVYYAKGVNVRPLGGAGANIWHSGSLPGTLSYAAKLARGWSYAAIFNKRPENWEQTIAQIDRLLGAASRKATAAAHGDLFEWF